MIQFYESVKLRIKCNTDGTLSSFRRDREHIISESFVWCSGDLYNLSHQMGAAIGNSKLITWTQLVTPSFVSPDGSITLEVEFPSNDQIVTTT